MKSKDHGSTALILVNNLLLDYFMFSLVLQTTSGGSWRAEYVLFLVGIHLGL